MRNLLALTLSFLVTCTAYAQQAYLVEDLNTTYPAQVALQKNEQESVTIDGYLYFITYNETTKETSIKRTAGSGPTETVKVFQQPELPPIKLFSHANVLVYQTARSLHMLGRLLFPNMLLTPSMQIVQLEGQLLLFTPYESTIWSVDGRGSDFGYSLGSSRYVSSPRKFGELLLFVGLNAQNKLTNHILNLRTRVIEEIPTEVTWSDGAPYLYNGKLYYLKSLDPNQIYGEAYADLYSYDLTTKTASRISFFAGPAGTGRQIQRMYTSNGTTTILWGSDTADSSLVYQFGSFNNHSRTLNGRVIDSSLLEDGRLLLLMHNQRDNSYSLQRSTASISSPLDFRVVPNAEKLLPLQSNRLESAPTYFVAEKQDSFELRSVAGTTSGDVSTLGNFSAQEIYGLARHGNKILLSAWQGSHQGSLLAFDLPTKALTPLLQESGRAASSSPRDLLAFNDALYFVATATFNNRVTAPALLKSNGMPGDIEVIHQFSKQDRVGQLFIRDALYFTVENGTGKSIWSSNGTSTGTKKLATVPQYSGTIVDTFFVGNSYITVAMDGWSSSTLHSLNLTSGATKPLATAWMITSIAASISNRIPETRLVSVGNLSAGYSFVTSLYQIKGTSEELTLLENIPTPIQWITTPDGAVGVWSTFAANLPQLEVGRFSSATATVTPITRSLGAPAQLFVAGTNIYAAQGGTLILIKENGELSQLATAFRNEMFSSFQFLYDSARNMTYLASTNSDGQGTLWSSDGTAAGTVALMQFDKTPIISFASLYKGSLYFSGYSAATGYELWKSDGTPAGTVMADDIAAGANSSSPNGFVALRNTLLFAANDGELGVELWALDQCEADPQKFVAGSCGCGISDNDTDQDGVADCEDLCPADPDKVIPGTCGCGTREQDLNRNGMLDCKEFTPGTPPTSRPGSNTQPVPNPPYTTPSSPEVTRTRTAAPSVTRRKRGWQIKMNTPGVSSSERTYTVLLKRIERTTQGRSRVIETVKLRSAKSSVTVGSLSKGTWQVSFVARAGLQQFSSAVRKLVVR
jgi:ELWxxDGT repeat protein